MVSTPEICPILAWLAIALVPLLPKQEVLQLFLTATCIWVHENYPRIIASPKSACMQVCHHCLKPLQQPSHVSAQGTFCSSACKQTAASAYHTVESALDLEPLQKYCRHFEERFPLLVTRAACMHLTQALRSPLQQQKLPAAEPPQGDVWQVQHPCLPNRSLVSLFCNHFYFNRS